MGLIRNQIGRSHRSNGPTTQANGPITNKVLVQLPVFVDVFFSIKLIFLRFEMNYLIRHVLEVFLAFCDI